MKRLTTQTNTRIYLESRESQQSLFSIGMAVLILMIFSGFQWLSIVLIVSTFFYPSLFLPIDLIVFICAFYPRRPTLLWKSFVYHPVFAHVRKYFEFSYLIEEELDPTVHYVMCHFPHGTHPLGTMVAATAVDQIFPDSKVFGISSDVVFSVPFYRLIFSWLGALPATSENFKKILQQGSCVVMVGGISEIYMQYSDHEAITLRNRRGFVRVALETGSPLVPVYHFGNSRMLHFGPHFLQKISRKLRTPLGLMYGRNGMPVPSRVPLFMVVGKPMPVPKMAHDHPNFEMTVQEVHERFVERVKKLYDDHKGKYGWENVPLVIQ